jgi:hypothetical protein
MTSIVIELQAAGDARNVDHSLERDRLALFAEPHLHSA